MSGNTWPAVVEHRVVLLFQSVWLLWLGHRETLGVGPGMSSFFSILSLRLSSNVSKTHGASDKYSEVSSFGTCHKGSDLVKR